MNIIALFQDHYLFKSWEVKDGPSPPHKMRIALNLICLFGQRYAEEIRAKLDAPHKKTFHNFRWAFYEIQKNLEVGINKCRKLYDFSVAKVLSEFPKTQNESKVFELLKKSSYEMLPFIQKARFQYKNPEQETIDAIEEARDKSFWLLLDTLERGVEERKGEEITEIDKKAIIQFYFKTGALVLNGRIIYWNEMVRMWGNLNRDNRLKFSNFLHLWKFRELIDEDGYSPVEAFTKDKNENGSFRKFLCECSIHSIEENLGVIVSSRARDLIIKKFRESEKIRSDVCYLSADREFATRSLSKEEPSYFLVRSFQIFQRLLRKFEVPEVVKSALLDALLFRDPNWDEKDFLELLTQEDKKWVLSAAHESVVDVVDIRIDSPRHERKNQDLEKDDWGKEKGSFQKAWEGLSRIISSLSNRSTTFCQSNCWNMLLFLWENPQRDICVETLLKLSGLDNFHIDLRACLNFFSLNANFSKDHSKLFLSVYREVIQYLEEKKLIVKNPEALFFDPAIRFDFQQFMHIMRHIAWFVQQIPTHVSSNDKGYYSMLLQYISNRVSKPLIELLNDGPYIGVDNKEALIPILFEGKYKPFEQGKEPDISKRWSRQVFVKAIQEKYQFSPRQIFAIYVGFLHIENARKIEQIEKLVTRFTEIFPYVNKNVIYFLYLSCACDLEPLEKFIEYREEWIREAGIHNKFVLSREACERMIAEIDLFLESFEAQGQPDGEFEKDKQRLKRFLLQTVFSAEQVLSDVFRITDLTHEGGIRWQNSFLGTHEGKMFLLAECKIGVYLHWFIVKGCPTLVMSYLDISDNRGLTACHSMQGLQDEFESEEKRKDFYGLLSKLATIVLEEEARHEPENDGEETPEAWAKAFDGVEEVIEEHRTIGADTLARIWDFLKRVKLSYRNLHFGILGTPNDKYENENGPRGMFPFQNTVALLPKELLDQQQEKRNYLPDADAQDLKIIGELFCKKTKEPTTLKLQLHVEGGPREIFYEVQPQGGVIEEEAKGRGADNIPSPFKSEDRLIVLSVGNTKLPFRYSLKLLRDQDNFGRFFHFHNLLLKLLVNLYRK